MSVEEAKRITASFKGAAFVPPPRTIEDITAILDQEQQENPEIAVKARSKLAEPVPSTTKPGELSRFFAERGAALRALGRESEAIDDLRRAVELAPAVGAPTHRLLTGLAAAEETGGEIERSLETYREAARKVPSSDKGWLFAIYPSQVWIEVRMGDLPGAQATLRKLVELEVESRGWPGVLPEWRASWEAGLATSRAAIAEARGEFAKAEVGYREAAERLASDPGLAKSYSHDLAHARIGRVLTSQGRLLEAEREARTALLGGLRRSGRYSFQTAVLLNYLTRVLSAQGRHREQEVLARTGLEILQKLGIRPDSIHIAFVRRQLADALNAQVRFEEALVELETIRTALAHQPGVFEKHYSTDVAFGITYVYVRQPDKALPLLTRVRDQAINRRGDAHVSVGLARGALAMAYRAVGEHERALEEFKPAVQILLGGRDNLSMSVEDTSQTPTRLKRLILVSYVSLLADIIGTPLEQKAAIDAPAEALRIADVARGQVVQQSLNAAAARASIADPALADLVRREQDALKQVTALQGAITNLMSQPSDRRDVHAVAALTREVNTLRRARQALTSQITKSYPAYAELVNPQPMTVDRMRAVLAPGEALISTLVTADRTIVAAVRQQGPLKIATVPVGANSLRSTIERLRRALDPSARTLSEVPVFDVEAAHTLYRHILEPVKEGWQDATSLIVVADGALVHLPFGLLVTKPVTLKPETGALFSNYREVPWLIRTHAITVLPTATSLTTLGALPPGDRTRRPFVGFGDPWFSHEQASAAVRQQSGPGNDDIEMRMASIALRATAKTAEAASAHLGMLPRLPETADELRSIALAMNADPTRDVFTGPRASEKTVKSMNLAGYRVVVFATHGLVPGELDGLTQPALALSAPSVADSDGDGLLTMEEILALRLNADWVVLSACNTAAGQGAESEAISGLGRAFFYAGARALLVSNWPVETTSAKALTTELFRRQSHDTTLTRARALQQTMNALIDGPGRIDPKTNTVIFSYAHPIFWAPFTLVGDGGQ